jgi:broad specificity phosphatase PhoE
VPAPRLLGLQRGPATITLVRHGQSLGNLADDAANQRGADHLDLDVRDADVELSATGERQADALRDWLGSAPDELRPTLVVASPFRRAADTALRATADLGLEVALDERLRERDLGVLDGLTGRGIRAEHAAEATRRERVGKFYYQPPSGESWADVALRVRSLLGDLRAGYQDDRVWLFSHQAVIMTFRYVLEGLTEAELMEADRTSRVGNVSLTTYRRSEGGPVLEAFGDTSIVDAAEAETTAEPSAGEQAGTHG